MQDTVKTNMGMELERTRSEHQTALTEAAAKNQALSADKDESLQQQREAFEEEIKRLTQRYEQDRASQEATLRAQAQSLHIKDQTIVQLRNHLQTEEEEKQLLLESATRDYEAEKLEMLEGHAKRLEEVREESRAAEERHREQEAALHEKHAEEMSMMRAEYEADLKRWGVEADRKLKEARQAKDAQSAQYCQQLAAVAVEQQKSVDQHRAQLRTKEREAQQAQVGHLVAVQSFHDCLAESFLTFPRCRSSALLQGHKMSSNVGQLVTYVAQ